MNELLVVLFVAIAAVCLLVAIRDHGPTDPPHRRDWRGDSE